MLFDRHEQATRSDGGGPEFQEGCSTHGLEANLLGQFFDCTALLVIGSVQVKNAQETF